MKVPYIDIKKSYSFIERELEESFSSVIKSGWIVLGKNVDEFETKYAKFSQTKFCIGVGCGLDAITISLKASGVKSGDEVIMPSNAYIAALNAVSQLGAIPRFVEPKEETFNIDPDLIEEKISKKTKAIIPVHLFGQACEMDPILKLADRYHLQIIEDNAQSHGSSYKGKKTGSFGIANATSFYPTKNIGALGEAGAITTNSAMIHKKAKMLRNYGEKSKYINEHIGYNSRLDELQAAFLLIKLKKIKKWTARRNEIATYYVSELKSLEDLFMPVTEKFVENVYHIFPIKCNARNRLQKFLTENGIGTSIHYPLPPYLQKAYSYLGYRKGDFPIAEKLADTELSLPIYPEMNNDQVEYVIKSIKKFFK